MLSVRAASTRQTPTFPQRLTLPEARPCFGNNVRLFRIRVDVSNSETSRAEDFLMARWPPAKKQRFTDGMKMLLDFAKESSDWFPPLKAALGGMNALIKHYEVWSGGRYNPQLTRTLAAIRGRQGEDRSSHTSVGEAQTKYHDDISRWGPRGDGSTSRVDRVRLPFNCSAHTH